MTQRKDSDAIDTSGSRIKFWGGAVIVLMIVLMFMPWNVGNRTHGPGESYLRGTASGGRKVMSREVGDAAAALEMLDGIRVVIRDPRRPTAGRDAQLLTAIWGEEIASHMKRNPEAYCLLLEESRKFGLGNNPRTLGPLDRDLQDAKEMGIFNQGTIFVSELHPLPGSQLYDALENGQIATQVFAPQMQADGYVSQLALSTLPPIRQQALHAALTDLLAVQAASSLVTSSIKPSTVMVDQLIARNRQTFTLQVGSIDSRPGVDAVTLPTDAELKAQLDKYAGVVAGRPTPENPFGFGYQVQNSVKLQMLIINRADVRAVVQAEKSAYEWEVDARMAYKRDAKVFAALAPTTAPTTSPATTSPAGDVAPFEQIKAGAVRLMLEKSTTARVDEIERKIRTTMSLDHQRWAAAKTTNTTTGPSSLGVDYESVDYLNKLAASIQSDARFKVLPVVVSEQSRFLDARALEESESIRNFTYTFEPAVAAALGVGQVPMPASVYLVELARPFMKKSIAERAGGAVLEVMKPSEVLEDSINERLAFVRLTDTLAAHPATDIEPIRNQLLADVKRANAQEQAEKQAASIADAIRSGGKFEVPGSKVSTVEIAPLQPGVNVPAELGLDLNGYEQFQQEVGRKLLADPNGSPVAVISVPVSQKVYVAQRLAIKPTWTSLAELEELRIGVQNRIAQRMSLPGGYDNLFGVTDKIVANSWIDVDAILARNEWKPVGANGKDNG